MSESPPVADWSSGLPGMYGLTLDELRAILLIVREAYEQRGTWLTATELRIALRKPGT